MKIIFLANTNNNTTSVNEQEGNMRLMRYSALLCLKNFSTFDPSIFCKTRPSSFLLTAFLFSIWRLSFVNNLRLPVNLRLYEKRISFLEHGFVISTYHMCLYTHGLNNNNNNKKKPSKLSCLPFVIVLLCKSMSSDCAAYRLRGRKYVFGWYGKRCWK